MNDVDPILPKKAVREATGGLSDATIWREQKAGRFPPYERISARRVGLRLSTLCEWQNGRRDWGGAA